VPQAQKSGICLSDPLAGEGRRAWPPVAPPTCSRRSKKWRIYRRMGPTRHDIVDFPIAAPCRLRCEMADRGAASQRSIAGLDRDQEPCAGLIRALRNPVSWVILSLNTA